MNTKLRKKAKNDSEKDFFKLMNNSVFGKTKENVRTRRNNKLITNEKRRNYLVSEPDYHTAKFFTKNLLAKMKHPTTSQWCVIKTSQWYVSTTSRSYVVATPC